MGAPDLLEHLKSLGLNVTVEGGEVRAGPKAALSDDVRAFIRTHKTELLAMCVLEGQVEARRQRVLSMLENNPGIRYALISDTEEQGDDVILALGIRGLGTCELAIPRAKYDPLKLLKLIQEETG